MAGRINRYVISLCSLGLGGAVAAVVAWAVLVTPASTALAGQITAQIDGPGDITIHHEGTPIVSMGNLFFANIGKPWSFHRFKERDVKKQDGALIAEGYITDWPVSLRIETEQISPREIQTRYILTVREKVDNLIGGGPEFKLDGQPALRNATDAQLLPDNTGWQWSLGEVDGRQRTIRVELDPEWAKVYFEKDRKRQIRTFFIGETLAAGEHVFTMTITLPQGAELIEPRGQFDPPDMQMWHINALDISRSPVDLTFLNHKPAGKHGRVRADGDDLVFADGTPARFWGCNVAAYTIFLPDDQIELHARRIAELGYNLVRIHHHDSMGWVDPTVIDKNRADSQQLNVDALGRLDYWIKCLREQGVYIWLDLHVGREFKEGDNVPGIDEVRRKGKLGKGFCYVNDRLAELMEQFNREYLDHENPHTGLKYKDDPGVVAVLLTNENNLTRHFGNLMLADKNVPYHNGLFEKRMDTFAAKSGLSRSGVGKTWEAGPSKVFLADLEHQYNARLTTALRNDGYHGMVATTDMFGRAGLYMMPSIAQGDITDAHDYGRPRALLRNPRSEANYIHWLGSTQVLGKPFASTEWNVMNGDSEKELAEDAFTAPMYMAATASLQGWDALMIYNYAQEGGNRFANRAGGSAFTTYADPKMTGMMPAAALAYRRGDIARAKKAILLDFTDDPHRIFFKGIEAGNSPTIRTAIETHRFAIALPEVKELPWLQPSKITPAEDGSVERISDLKHDFTGGEGEVITSDTGEIRRHFVQGFHTVITPRTVSAAGWFTDEPVDLGSVKIDVDDAAAAVVVNAMDDKPIHQSQRLLLTAIARSRLIDSGKRYASEPVTGRVHLQHESGTLEVIPLAATGERGDPINLQRDGQGDFIIDLTQIGGTHWWLIEAR